MAHTLHGEEVKLRKHEILAEAQAIALAKAKAEAEDADDSQDAESDTLSESSGELDAIE